MRTSVAERIIKWMILYWAPDVDESQLQLDWKIDRSGRFAFPFRPLQPLLVGTIFDRLKKSSRLELASRSEIADLGLRVMGVELVRDYLPANFSPSDGVFAENLATWNGKEASFMTKEAITKVKLLWRPRIRLDLSS